MLSITNAVEALANGLEAYFDAHGYTWKACSSVEAFEPKKPTIYPFCIPPTDINAAQMPCNCPCLLLALEKWTKVDAKRVRLFVSVNCVVVDAAELDKEKLYASSGGGFEYGKGDDYEQNASALYRGALLLAECVVDAVSLMTHTQNAPLVMDVSEFEPPHALLPDYPYSVCVVPVTIDIVNNGATDQTFNDLL